MNEPTSAFSFGDKVRINETSHTAKVGIAGLFGTVHGFTTPSLTGVTPVGPLAEDFAFNVYIEALENGFWLDPGSIEFVSRPQQMDFSVGGKTIRVTQKDGVFKEEIVKSRPWWRFW
jgi:hypothetical protein